MSASGKRRHVQSSRQMVECNNLDPHAISSNLCLNFLLVRHPERSLWVHTEHFLPCSILISLVDFSYQIYLIQSIRFAKSKEK